MDGMQDIVKKLPFWEHLSDDERALVLGQSALRTFDAGQLIGGSDSSCTGVFLIVHGDIRVSLLSEEGKEVTLFRLGEGECCVTTASCVIRQISFDTLVTATRESTLLVVPIGVCEHLANVNIHVKVFMLEVEAQRYSQVVRVLQQMLFRRLDQRVADYLVERCRAAESMELRITQDELARDINSAREAVTRVLRRLADEGLIEVKRGRILVLDVDGLACLP